MRFRGGLQVHRVGSSDRSIFGKGGGLGEVCRIGGQEGFGGRVHGGGDGVWERFVE